MTLTLDEIKELAERMWEGCDENDKDFWIKGFITGYLLSKSE